MRRCLGLLLLLMNGGVNAAEVVATLADGKLGVRVDAIAFPESLSKELTSGLTNRLFARVSLMAASDMLQQRTVELAIRYDLWDEKFFVVRTMSSADESHRQTTLAEINAMLGALPLPSLFEVAKLPAARELTLRVELLLNPIDREKLRMIRKWVAQNSMPDARAEKGISTSNNLFNQIFEQVSESSDFAAVWRIEATSKPFRVDNLPHEGR